MNNIQFYCDKCPPLNFEPHYELINDLETLKNIVNSNYCTLVLYNKDCENCKNISENFTNNQKYVETLYWMSFLSKVGIFIKNMDYMQDYGHYTLEHNKIYKISSEGRFLVTEEEFLKDIKNGTTFTKSGCDKAIRDPLDNAYGVVKINNADEIRFFGACGPRGLTGSIGWRPRPYKEYNDSIIQKILDNHFTIEKMLFNSTRCFYRINHSPMIKPARKN